MRNYFDISSRVHNYFSGLNKNVLFGNNYDHVRNVQSVTNTQTLYFNAIPNMKDLPADQKAGAVNKRLEEINKIVKDNPNMKMTAEAFQALSRGDAVAVKIDQEAPARRNLVIGFASLAAQLIGAAAGASFNKELSDAISERSQGDVDFVKEYGGSYKMNPFGGAEAIKGSITVVPINSPEEKIKSPGVEKKITEDFVTKRMLELQKGSANNKVDRFKDAESYVGAFTFPRHNDNISGKTNGLSIEGNAATAQRSFELLGALQFAQKNPQFAEKLLANINSDDPKTKEFRKFLQDNNLITGDKVSLGDLSKISSEMQKNPALRFDLTEKAYGQKGEGVATSALGKFLETNVNAVHDNKAGDNWLTSMDIREASLNPNTAKGTAMRAMVGDFVSVAASAEMFDKMKGMDEKQVIRMLAASYGIDSKKYDDLMSKTNGQFEKDFKAFLSGTESAPVEKRIREAITDVFKEKSNPSAFADQFMKNIKGSENASVIRSLGLTDFSGTNLASKLEGKLVDALGGGDTGKKNLEKIKEGTFDFSSLSAKNLAMVANVFEGALAATQGNVDDNKYGGQHITTLQKAVNDRLMTLNDGAIGLNAIVNGDTSKLNDTQRKAAVDLYNQANPTAKVTDFAALEKMVGEKGLSILSDPLKKASSEIGSIVGNLSKSAFSQNNQALQSNMEISGDITNDIGGAVELIGQKMKGEGAFKPEDGGSVLGAATQMLGKIGSDTRALDSESVTGIKDKFAEAVSNQLKANGINLDPAQTKSLLEAVAGGKTLTDALTGLGVKDAGKVATAIEGDANLKAGFDKVVEVFGALNKNPVTKGGPDGPATIEGNSKSLMGQIGALDLSKQSTETGQNIQNSVGKVQGDLEASLLKAGVSSEVINGFKKDGVLDAKSLLTALGDDKFKDIIKANPQLIKDVTAFGELQDKANTAIAKIGGTVVKDNANALAQAKTVTPTSPEFPIAEAKKNAFADQILAAKAGGPGAAAAIEKIKAGVGGTDAADALKALAYLSRGGNEGATNALAQLTKDGNTGAAKALADLAQGGKKEALTALLDIAKSGANPLAMAEVVNLAKGGNSDALNAVIDISKNKDLSINMREKGIAALSEMAPGNAKALGALIDIGKDSGTGKDTIESNVLRSKVVESLTAIGKTGNADAIDALKSIANDKTAGTANSPAAKALEGLATIAKSGEKGASAAIGAISDLSKGGFLISNEAKDAAKTTLSTLAVGITPKVEPKAEPKLDLIAKEKLGKELGENAGGGDDKALADLTAKAKEDPSFKIDLELALRKRGLTEDKNGLSVVSSKGTGTENSVEIEALQAQKYLAGAKEEPKVEPAKVGNISASNIEKITDIKALTALAGFGNKDAINQLGKIATGEVKGDAKAALESLSSLAKDTSNSFRGLAIDKLTEVGKTGNTGAIEALKSIADDETASTVGSVANKAMGGLSAIATSGEKGASAAVMAIKGISENFSDSAQKTEAGKTLVSVANNITAKQAEGLDVKSLSTLATAFDPKTAKDPANNVAMKQLGAMAGTGNLDAAKSLSEMSKGDSPVKDASAQLSAAVKKLGDDGNIGALQKFAKEGIAGALGKLESVASQDPVNANSLKALVALKKLSDDGFLIFGKVDGASDKLNSAINELGKKVEAGGLGAKEALESLMTLSKDGSGEATQKLKGLDVSIIAPELKVEQLATLAKLGTKGALEQLGVKVGSDDKTEATAALGALMTLAKGGSAEATQKLKGLDISKIAPELKVEQLSDLSKLGNKGAVEQLGAKAVGGDTKALEALVSVAKDGKNPERSTAIQQLGIVAQNATGKDATALKEGAIGALLGISKETGDNSKSTPIADKAGVILKGLTKEQLGDVKDVKQLSDLAKLGNKGAVEQLGAMVVGDPVKKEAPNLEAAKALMEMSKGNTPVSGAGKELTAALGKLDVGTLQKFAEKGVEGAVGALQKTADSGGENSAKALLALKNLADQGFLFIGTVSGAKEGLTDALKGIKVGDVGKIEDTKALSLLANSGGSDAIKNAALEQLGKLAAGGGKESKAALEALVSIVKDDKSSVRDNAFSQLATVAQGTSKNKEGAIKALLDLSKETKDVSDSSGDTTTVSTGMANKAKAVLTTGLTDVKELSVNTLSDLAKLGNDSSMTQLGKLASDNSDIGKLNAGEALKAISAMAANGNVSALQQLDVVAKGENKTTAAGAIGAMINISKQTEDESTTPTAFAKQATQKLTALDATAIGGISDSKVLSGLAKINDKAVEQLGKLASTGDQGAIKALVELSGDNKTPLEQAATKKIGEVITALGTAAGSTDAGTANKAIEGLNTLAREGKENSVTGKNDAVTKLQDLAIGGNGKALVALSKLADEGFLIFGKVGGASDGLKKAVDTISKDMSKVNDPAVLGVILKVGDDTQKAKAIEQLGNLAGAGNKDALDMLTKLMKSGATDEIKGAATDALGAAAGVNMEALKTLTLVAYNGKSEKVDQALAKAIDVNAKKGNTEALGVVASMTGDKSAIIDLEAIAINDKDPDKKVKALDRLIELAGKGDKDAMESLVNVAKSGAPDSGKAVFALSGLAKTGNIDATQKLQEIALGTNPENAKIAAGELVDIQNDKSNPASAAALAGLIAVAQQNPNLVFGGQKDVEKIPPKTVLDFVQGVAETGNADAIKAIANIATDQRSGGNTDLASKLEDSASKGIQAMAAQGGSQAEEGLRRLAGSGNQAIATQAKNEYDKINVGRTVQGAEAAKPEEEKKGIGKTALAFLGGLGDITDSLLNSGKIDIAQEFFKLADFLLHKAFQAASSDGLFDYGFSEATQGSIASSYKDFQGAAQLGGASVAQGTYEMASKIGGGQINQESGVMKINRNFLFADLGEYMVKRQSEDEGRKSGKAWSIADARKHMTDDKFGIGKFETNNPVLGDITRPQEAVKAEDASVTASSLKDAVVSGDVAKAGSASEKAFNKLVVMAGKGDKDAVNALKDIASKDDPNGKAAFEKIGELAGKGDKNAIQGLIALASNKDGNVQDPVQKNALDELTKLSKGGNKEALEGIISMANNKESSKLATNATNRLAQVALDPNDGFKVSVSDNKKEAVKALKEIAGSSDIISDRSTALDGLVGLAANGNADAVSAVSDLAKEKANPDAANALATVKKAINDDSKFKALETAGKGDMGGLKDLVKAGNAEALNQLTLMGRAGNTDAIDALKSLANDKTAGDRAPVTLKAISTAAKALDSLSTIATSKGDGSAGAIAAISDLSTGFFVSKEANAAAKATLTSVANNIGEQAKNLDVKSLSTLAIANSTGENVAMKQLTELAKGGSKEALSSIADIAENKDNPDALRTLAIDKLTEVGSKSANSEIAKSAVSTLKSIADSDDPKSDKALTGLADVAKSGGKGASEAVMSIKSISENFSDSTQKTNAKATLTSVANSITVDQAKGLDVKSLSTLAIANGTGKNAAMEQLGAMAAGDPVKKEAPNLEAAKALNEIAKGDSPVKDAALLQLKGGKDPNTGNDVKGVMGTLEANGNIGTLQKFAKEGIEGALGKLESVASQDPANDNSLKALVALKKLSEEGFLIFGKVDGASDKLNAAIDKLAKTVTDIKPGESFDKAQAALKSLMTLSRDGSGEATQKLKGLDVSKIAPELKVEQLATLAKLGNDSAVTGLGDKAKGGGTEATQAIRELVSVAKDENNTARGNAIDKLGAVALDKMATGPNKDLAIGALLGISKETDSESNSTASATKAESVLSKLDSSQIKDVSVSTLTALANTGNVDAVKGLGDKAKAGDTKALESIVSVAKDGSNAARGTAIDQLGIVAQSATGEDATTLKKGAISALLSISKETDDDSKSTKMAEKAGGLLKGLTLDQLKGNTDVKMLTELSKLGNTDAIKQIGAMAGDSSSSNNQSAIKALAELSKSSDTNISGNAKTQINIAASALTTKGDDNAIKGLQTFAREGVTQGVEKLQGMAESDNDGNIKALAALKSLADEGFLIFGKVEGASEKLNATLDKLTTEAAKGGTEGGNAIAKLEKAVSTGGLKEAGDKLKSLDIANIKDVGQLSTLAKFGNEDAMKKLGEMAGKEGNKEALTSLMTLNNGKVKGADEQLKGIDISKLKEDPNLKIEQLSTLAKLGNTSALDKITTDAKGGNKDSFTALTALSTGGLKEAGDKLKGLDVSKIAPELKLEQLATLAKLGNTSALDKITTDAKGGNKDSFTALTALSTGGLKEAGDKLKALDITNIKDVDQLSTLAKLGTNGAIEKLGTLVTDKPDDKTLTKPDDKALKALTKLAEGGVEGAVKQIQKSADKGNTQALLALKSLSDQGFLFIGKVDGANEALQLSVGKLKTAANGDGPASVNAINALKELAKTNESALTALKDVAKDTGNKGSSEATKSLRELAIVNVDALAALKELAPANDKAMTAVTELAKINAPGAIDALKGLGDKGIEKLQEVGTKDAIKALKELAPASDKAMTAITDLAKTNAPGAIDALKGLGDKGIDALQKLATTESIKALKELAPSNDKAVTSLATLAKTNDTAMTALTDLGKQNNSGAIKALSDPGLGTKGIEALTNIAGDSKNTGSTAAINALTGLGKKDELVTVAKTNSVAVDALKGLGKEGISALGLVAGASKNAGSASAIAALKDIAGSVTASKDINKLATDTLGTVAKTNTSAVDALKSLADNVFTTQAKTSALENLQSLAGNKDTNPEASASAIKALKALGNDGIKILSDISAGATSGKADAIGALKALAANNEKAMDALTQMAGKGNQQAAEQLKLLALSGNLNAIKALEKANSSVMLGKIVVESRNENVKQAAVDALERIAKSNTETAKDADKIKANLDKTNAIESLKSLVQSPDVNKDTILVALKRIEAESKDKDIQKKAEEAIKAIESQK